jgi:hypothetical protein
VSPPRDDADRPLTQGPATAAESDNPTTNKPKVYRRRGVLTVRHASQDTPSQLRRRRAASYRLPVISCGQHRDVIGCDCFDPEPPLSDNAIDGWRAAINRTLPIGPAIVPIVELQRLWRNGGPDRELAQRVWSETGGLVA